MKSRQPFWFFFYNAVVVPLLYLGIQATRPFNAKVRRGYQEHKGLFQRLAELKKSLPSDRRIIAVHCASAGEFEAARPVLTLLKRRFERLHTHVTYFSPSGLKPISKADNVDSFSHLPFDDPISTRRFFRILNPLAFVFVKHDVWPNMVWAAADHNVPIVWINANLHEKSRRLGLLGRGLSRSFLNDLTAILTVADSHALRLSSLVSPEKIEVVGDSRYDRTANRMRQSEVAGSELLPASWIEEKKVLLGGSTWGPDQRVLIPAYAELKKDYPDLYLILVPHEPHPDFLADTDYYLYGTGLRPVRYSQLNCELPPSDVLIVDKVGILANLYRSAWVAYIGGAFGEGVHSVLEPAVYGLPLFFGPRYYMAHEAQSLVKCEAATSVTSPQELERGLRRFLQDEKAWRCAAEASRRLTESGLGAAERIVNYLQQLIPELNNR